MFWSQTGSLEPVSYTHLDVYKRQIYGPVKGNDIWRRLYNRELYERFKDLPIVQFIQINRLRWAGHVQGITDDRIPKKNQDLFADGKEKERKTAYKMAGPGW